MKNKMKMIFIFGFFCIIIWGRFIVVVRGDEAFTSFFFIYELKHLVYGNIKLSNFIKVDNTIKLLNKIHKLNQSSQQQQKLINYRKRKKNLLLLI